MKVIVTHENADLDAVASQLAASKLVPGALPLLPNRLNRNVRHFTTLYQDTLPFVRAKDLPREPVEQVIVVDSQTVPTLRGQTDDTEIWIIDHHTPALPDHPRWQVTTEQVGAATTILCERIQNAGVSLSPIEATLLLLGIHEDTGSLTYASTTTRDVYAAGWLLDQGALLDTVRQFLHSPLSDEQRELYHRLLENTTTHQIEGYEVVIAAGSAPDLLDEVAVLAHQIRMLYDAAALFLLVDLGSHIQLVARSSIDPIDVGQVAATFGGGGHRRAAAAMLNDMTLQQAQERLLEVLPQFVRPRLTVADIMSHGVHTLPAHRRVRDAAKQMRRYGDEGFPVVENGAIVGLLTRRAIDRALEHGLDGVEISRLMDAGRITVRPGDSANTLQSTMMTTGWGQVPVVDGSGKLLGIVTRTDLIKNLHRSDQPAAGNLSVAALLDEALPPILLALVQEIGRTTRSLGMNLYVVGGFVRDLLLGAPTIDIDFVVEGDTNALVRTLKGRFGGDTRSHARFGTGKWMLDAATWGRLIDHFGVPCDDLASLPNHLDFATARREFYDSPTALPDVERSNIKGDLHRRDFTINTLAIRLDPEAYGELLDFYNGLTDLRNRQIRVLHSLSFVDDPTRILRAVRLEQRLRFEIEPRTEELIHDALPMVERVSGDRIRHEIESILVEHDPAPILSRLDQLGVLRTINPELACDGWAENALRALAAARRVPLWPEIGQAAGFDPSVSIFAILTYRMSAEARRAICRYLKVRRRTEDMLDRLQQIRGQMEALSVPLKPSQVDTILDRASDPVLLAAWAAAPTAHARRHVRDYALRLRWIRPVTDGEALKKRGLSPGPHFGEILGRLREAWLDGEVSTPAEEQALLDHLLSEVLI
ncbi:MAG: CBS domain-containing protein [Chloroflexota bacterium]